MSPLSDRTIEQLQKRMLEPDLTQTKYRLVREIDQGGMASVYLVQDPELQREAALKVLHPSDSGPDLAKRLEQEARILANLEHPAIVPVHDVGILPDGRVFYVMKYVQGRRLDKHLETIESVSERLRIFEKICDAVAFAHSRGFIHRDLKPENVMVGSFGEVLVMDWGLAKSLHSVHEESGDLKTRALRKTDTEGGTVMGTPGYRAPEQERGEVSETDERSDVYSLGAILHYMLAQRAPTTEHGHDLGKEIPRSLKAICTKSLSQLKQDRYPSAKELLEDVQHYRDGLRVQAYRESWIESAARFLSKHSFLVILILAYLLMRALVMLIYSR